MSFIGETLEEVALRYDKRNPEEIERQLVHRGLTPYEVLDYLDSRQGGLADAKLREELEPVAEHLREKYCPGRRRY